MLFSFNHEMLREMEITIQYCSEILRNEMNEYQMLLRDAAIHD